MDRTKRETDKPNWENPCGYQNTAVLSYEPSLARQVQIQAAHAWKLADQYKDIFSKVTQSYASFSKLLEMWEKNEWLRSIPWIKDDVFPSNKVIYQGVPVEQIENLMERIDVLLPNMYLGLQLVGRALEKMKDVIPEEGGLKSKTTDTMYEVSSVLCYFYDVLAARNLHPEALEMDLNSVPDFNPENYLSLMVLVYRDTLNYLQYLEIFFEVMHESVK